MRIRQKVILTLACLSLIFLFFLIVFGDNGLVDLNRLNGRKEGLIEKNQMVEQENIELYRTIKRAKDDPEYIESVARDELGMVGKDEIIIKFKDKEAVNNSMTATSDR